MDDDIRQLAERQHAVFARRQVCALGATPAYVANKLRTGEWVRAERGVYRIAGAPLTEMSRLVVAWLVAGDGAIVSHESAAALHGLPGYALLPATIAVPAARSPKAAGSRTYRSTSLPPGHVVARDGVRVTSVARTAFDLCGRVHPKRAERSLDVALGRNLTSLLQCWHVLLDLAEHGRNGTVVMRELLEARRTPDGIGPESEIEDRFLRLVRRHALPEPQRQVDLGDDDGWIGRVDFWFPAARVVVETDGWPWHRSKLDREADAARDARLEASGRRVIRLVWADVTTRAPLTVRRLRAALATRSLRD